jgi:hypothetical protein
MYLKGDRMGDVEINDGGNVGAEVPDDVAGFVEQFAAAWRAGAEGLRKFESLLDPDVLLRQPLMPTVRGSAGFRAQFDAIFAAVPDLRGEVLAWGPTGDGVLIDLGLRGTVGGRPVELVTCDRIVLKDGRLRERHARMDPLPLVRATLARPRTALRLLRSSRGVAADRGRAAPVDGPGPLVAAAKDGRAGLSDGSAPLAALAIGRLVLGTFGRVSPRATARALGAGEASSPELDYLTRIFGARAIALGTGYLTSRGAASRRWQRIALGVDFSDTIAGIGHLRRRDVPLPSALALTALTGSYTAVGAARLVRDLARLA